MIMNYSNSLSINNNNTIQSQRKPKTNSFHNESDKEEKQLTPQVEKSAKLLNQILTMAASFKQENNITDYDSFVCTLNDLVTFICNGIEAHIQLLLAQNDLSQQGVLDFYVKTLSSQLKLIRARTTNEMTQKDFNINITNKDVINKIKKKIREKKTSCLTKKTSNSRNWSNNSSICRVTSEKSKSKSKSKRRQVVNLESSNINESFMTFKDKPIDTREKFYSNKRMKTNSNSINHMTVHRIEFPFSHENSYSKGKLLYDIRRKQFQHILPSQYIANLMNKTRKLIENFNSLGYIPKEAHSNKNLNNSVC